MTFLVVTPARDERERLPLLAGSLAAQEPGLVALWVVVDDGSADGTAELAEGLDLPFPVTVLRRPRTPDTGLHTASEFAAFVAGADLGLVRVPDVARVMKCDADVVLAAGYLRAVAGVPATVGITGGRIETAGERVRHDYVRGAVKAYSRDAYALVRELPAALGWDVLDEVAVRRAGLATRPCPEASVRLTRRTGSSAGALRGFVRGGVVSRWCGYRPGYFGVRLLRYAARRPVVLGAAAMLFGYVRAGRGPWPADLRAALRAEQAQRLRRLARSPLRGARTFYASRPSPGGD